MLALLNDCNREIIALSAPTHMKPDGTTVSSETLREMSVFWRGGLERLEVVIDRFFGGVP